MMGSGKSTLSHLICDKIGYDFIDTDSIIESNEAMSITDIFSSKGEAYFRSLEFDLLNSLEVSSAVISTGGGMILSSANREILKSKGTVFYLSGSVETLCKRLSNQTSNRPLLQTNALKKQLEDLLRKRSDLYLDACHHVISIDNKSIDTILSEIYAILSE